MRIAFVAARAWPAVGGIESYLHDLTIELAQRHDVSVLALGVDDSPRGRLSESLRPPPRFAPFAYGAVSVRSLRPSTAQRALLAPLALQSVPVARRYAYGRVRAPLTSLYARVLAEPVRSAVAGADVVHMWGGGMLAAAALRASRALGAPFAITPFAHDGHWGDDAAVARTYRGADAVVALLETEASTYARLGVAPERVHVAGVLSPGVAGGGGAAVRRAHGIDGPIVLFLGARRAYKGADLLAECAPEVAAAVPGVTFVFAGPGDPVHLGGAHAVDAGHVDERERAAWLDAADVLCLPSSSEIFPTSFLEAWSVGTPVVTTDIPPLAELMRISGGGTCVPRTRESLVAGLVAALRSPQELRTMGGAGNRFWRERCTPAAVAASYERLYESLLAGGRAREAA